MVNWTFGDTYVKTLYEGQAQEQKDRLFNAQLAMDRLKMEGEERRHQEQMQEAYKVTQMARENQTYLMEQGKQKAHNDVADQFRKSYMYVDPDIERYVKKYRISTVPSAELEKSWVKDGLDPEDIQKGAYLDEGNAKLYMLMRTAEENERMKLSMQKSDPKLMIDNYNQKLKEDYDKLPDTSIVGTVPGPTKYAFVGKHLPNYLDRKVLGMSIGIERTNPTQRERIDVDPYRSAERMSKLIDLLGSSSQILSVDPSQINNPLHSSLPLDLYNTYTNIDSAKLTQAMDALKEISPSKQKEVEAFISGVEHNKSILISNRDKAIRSIETSKLEDADKKIQIQKIMDEQSDNNIAAWSALQYVKSTKRQYSR